MREADDLIQDLGCSSSQGKMTDVDRNPEVTEVGSMAMEVHHTFARDTTNSKVEVLLVQPAQDMYFAEAGKVAYTHPAV
jgi:hypothetical protein